MAYIGSSPTKVVSRQSANIFTYTVSVANMTVFSGADDNGNTLACSPSDIMVHINGLKNGKVRFFRYKYKRNACTCSGKIGLFHS